MKTNLSFGTRKVASPTKQMKKKDDDKFYLLKMFLIYTWPSLLLGIINGIEYKKTGNEPDFFEGVFIYQVIYIYIVAIISNYIEFSKDESSKGKSFLYSLLMSFAFISGLGLFLLFVSFIAYGIAAAIVYNLF